MKRQGGGFGFVVMLVVLVVMFFLAMKNFKTAAPAAMEIKKHNEERRNGQDVTASDASATTSTSASADAWTPAPPSRPNLSTMDQKTSEHSDAVKDALSQAN